MSQLEEQKTAKQWLKDRGFVVESVEQAFDLDRQAQQLEEYASQQTTSLQKQHREESVKLANIVREQYQKDIESLQKQVEELRKEYRNALSDLGKAYNKKHDAWIASLKEGQQLQAENAAANKRIEELTAKNLKLLNENNDLWDKVNNPKFK